MSLGIALSKLKVFSLKESLTYSLVRVLVGPLVGLFFVKFFDLSGVEAGVMFIQAAMPSAILTYLISKMYSTKKYLIIYPSTDYAKTTQNISQIILNLMSTEST